LRSPECLLFPKHLHISSPSVCSLSAIKLHLLLVLEEVHERKALTLGKLGLSLLLRLLHAHGLLTTSLVHILAAKDVGNRLVKPTATTVGTRQLACHYDLPNKFMK
jgi:uncharacterized membrane protein YqjE